MDLLHSIADTVNETEVTKLRVYPRSYLGGHRSGRYARKGTSLQSGSDQLVFTYTLNCSELDDDRLDEIMGRMPDTYAGVFQVRYFSERQSH